MTGSKLFGTLLVFAVFQHIALSADCNPSLRKCKECLDPTFCASCEDWYTPTHANDGCCSDGCAKYADTTRPTCNVTTGHCFLGNCENSLNAGPECLPCPVVIKRCDICNEDQTGVICITCVPGYQPTANQTSCCPEGCASCLDSCVSTDPTGCTCTSCKPGYSPYLNTCDTCSDNCPKPADNSSRCDPTDGKCTAPCEDGRFGSWCNVTCSIPNCNECAYDEPNNLLTCVACANDFYGPSCTACSPTCQKTPATRVCQQDNGFCINACNPGYRGNQCEINCRDANGLANCQQCERFNYICTRCDAGWYGTRCQDACNENCAPSPGTGGVVACDINNGTCLSGCLTQHYKPDCSGLCPNCLNDICNRTLGTCIERTCKPGFFGLDCNNTCPETCRNNKTTGLPGCDFLTGSCTNGCDYNRYGSHCQFQCSQFCKPLSTGVLIVDSEPVCHQSNGTCKDECVDKYFRHNCTDECHSLCVDERCDVTSGRCEACNEPVNIFCPTADCAPFRAGLFCNDTCPTNCKDGICARYGGACSSCIDGFWGINCTNTCGECGGVACDQSSGICSSCNDEYYGPTCTTPCVFVGCQTCGGDGLCTSCKPGRHGFNCNETCSEFCDSEQKTCDRFNASCAVNRCEEGYYLQSCSVECYEHCGVNSNGTRPCNIITGVCDMDDCDFTWHGPQCRFKCPSTCINQNCDRDGNCRQGCIDGWFGAKCQSECLTTCNIGTCDRDLGTCAACNSTNPAPLCRTADCPVGSWGLYCNQTCPAQCSGGICDRNSSDCNSCNDGYWSPKCTSLCPNCRNNKCFLSDGQCIFGCNDGFYTPSCMTPCKHTGCQNCTRDAGECLSCKVGKYGDADCSFNCSRYCGTGANITCNKVSGDCDSGRCIERYWARNCSRVCSAYCDLESCDIEDGTCTPCVIGWYGNTCSRECDNRCKNKDCVTVANNCRQGCTDGFWGGSCELNCSATCNLKACDKNTARCLYGCQNNQYHGDNCEQPCDPNCAGGVCNINGTCETGCKVGFYGDQCQFQCLVNSTCVDGTCNRVDGLCDDCRSATPGTNCPEAECPNGKRGDSCEMNCSSSNCLYNQCTRYNDTCKACPLELYGQQCGLFCPNCRENTACRQSDGVCVVGCSNGWFGQGCLVKCSNLCESCDRVTGQCTSCIDGRYGANCDKTCSGNCKETMVNGLSVIRCDKSDGACTEDECKSGYWSPACNQTCPVNCQVDVDGLKYCALIDGACTDGCVPTYYGKLCNGICSDRCRNKLCQDSEDTCLQGCADGYYGPTCTNMCSRQCAGTGSCNSLTGKCDAGCKTGYYGDRCLDQCVNECQNGSCDSTGICPDCRLDPVGPQCQRQVCSRGKYGPLCENNCPGAYCQDNRCHRQSGNCSNGCLEDYHGLYCTEQCDCDAIGTERCDQLSGNCVCISTRYGDTCSSTCNDGCVDFVCQKNGECTQGCKLGRYGSMCANTCTNCRSLSCSMTTGTCELGCNNGWFGDMCNQPCPANCLTCDRNSGSCVTCKDDYYNPQSNCGMTCSIRCATPSSGSRFCNMASGVCLNGCVSGYYGEGCTETCGNCADGTCSYNDGGCSLQGCVAGWYGTRCKDLCSQNCARGGNDNTLRCNQNGGACSYGCINGYHGDQCTSTCNTNCLNGKCTSGTQCTEGCIPFYYGSGCTNNCPNCAQGDCATSGRCESGCVAGYYGTNCNDECTQTCLDNRCDVSTGRCSDCSLATKGPLCRDQDPVTVAPSDDGKVDLSVGEILGISAGCVGIVILFVIVFVCCVNYMRRAEDAKNEIHLPSDVLERLSTHRSLHSTISTNYPVARVVGDQEHDKDFALF